MALTINLSTKTMRVAAGEPIVFAYQPTNGAGVPESLTDRAFVFSIYDAERVSRGYFDATVVPGPDPVAMWRLNGLISERLLDGSGLRWEIAERLHDGKDPIAAGSLTVDVSAPAVADYNSAPISRYITRITRKNDPETIDAPRFTIKIAAYAPVAVAPSRTLTFLNLEPLRFSDSNYLELSA
ncbi:hypothetical protein [Sphingomonas sp. Leaf242]|uniref:hypothetical protein n=1 Tax=Sphingomonas sp. Leaf242 TaxID=1736304 RepID=UPI00138F2CC1|nr:hypothetical protein [Sphingomonas sp. Leaf242]